jgi:S1-C subfamily serine protease
VKRHRLVAGGIVVAAAIVAGVVLTDDERAPDPAVVRVQLKGATTAAEVATGFVVAPGRVVTVAHVLTRGRRIVVRDGSGRVHSARLTRKDSNDDLALLSVRGLEDGPELRLHRVAAVGTPLRILVPQSAITARLTRPIRATLRGPNSGPDTRPALQLRAQVALGDSGAPVVDDDGRVAGVLFARASNGSPTAYAVDSAALDKFLAR